jgi:putative endonuclease
VKTRRSTLFGRPAEAIGPAKVHRLRKLAARWLAATGAHAGELRFDVVEVLMHQRDGVQVEHIRAAF